MKTQFPKEPTCEVCQDEPADRFVAFEVLGGKERRFEWKFCGPCQGDEGIYEIPIDRFFSSPASTVDWFAHLHEKTWMNWTDFANMMDRFREATQSYGQE